LMSRSTLVEPLESVKGKLFAAVLVIPAKS
jgi:hypothetical protein